MAEKSDGLSAPTWRVEADAEITRAMVKKSARRFVWCQLGVGYLIAMGILLLCLLFFIAIRDYGWLTGALGVILGLGLIFPISMWRNLESERLSRLEQMEMKKKGRNWTLDSAEKVGDGACLTADFG